jgi:hypothetical protein
MHPTFASHVKTLEWSLQRLITMAPVSRGTLPREMPVSGVYLLSERGEHMYVGRSDRMNEWVFNHGNPCATHRLAAFRGAIGALGNWVRQAHPPEGRWHQGPHDQARVRGGPPERKGTDRSHGHLLRGREGPHAAGPSRNVSGNRVRDAARRLREPLTPEPQPPCQT